MVTYTQVLAHTDIHIHNLKKNSKSPPSQNYPLQTLWWVCQVPWPSREDSGLRWPKMWGVGLQRASPCTPLKLQSLGQLLLSQLLSGVHLWFPPQERVLSTSCGRSIYGNEIKFRSPISHHIFLSFWSSFSIIFNRVKW